MQVRKNALKAFDYSLATVSAEMGTFDHVGSCPSAWEVTKHAAEQHTHTLDALPKQLRVCVLCVCVRVCVCVCVCVVCVCVRVCVVCVCVYVVCVYVVCVV